MRKDTKSFETCEKATCMQSYIDVNILPLEKSYLLCKSACGT